MRIHGLDTLRAAAIVLVLMYHYGVVAGGSDFGAAGRIGWAGVDLFFVLSGYLIGNQILSQRMPLSTFFGRRLLRTLPNYYVVLAVYFLFPAALGGSATAPLWRFLTFTQNFGLEYGQTFTHAWSLCIEEQFYLVLPLAVLLLRRPRWGWLAMALAVACAVTFRALAWSKGLQPFSQEVYYASFARFDELLPGVAIAMLKNFHRPLYDRILRHGNLLLAAGLVLCGVLLARFYDESFVMTAFGFTLLALSFALLLLAALSPASLLARVRVPGAESLALWSYAVYLAHKPLFKIVGEAMPLDRHAAPGIALVMLAGVGGGWLLYQLVEQPFMRLRAAWFPVTPYGGTVRTT
ncbi:acyltransferase family protein [Pseudoduganella sp. FT26W]|uniref:Acyltransferase family protein n=1 Tax=Duganella aquatilis TaxID=2666082 RepID=A0A844DDF3_9BURK|nr:acyltransferase [Duganella aquatilis]MRW86050.1 acyltransferase family protein [Duganella aquatilis]